MTKKSGLGATLAIDDSGGTARNVYNDLLSVNVGTPRGIQEITGIDKSAKERLLLLADGSMAYTGVFDDTSSTGSHAVFSSAASTSVIRTHTYTVQSKVLAMEMFIPDYPLSRGADGALTFSITAMLGDGAVPTWA